MDNFKYLPPKFSRSVTDLVEALNLEVNINMNLGSEFTGDINSVSG